MEINSFFQIGKDHKICEDYAISGTVPFPYAIVSDGCSSNLNTDIGARILVSLTKKNIHLFNPEYYTDFVDNIIFQSKALASTMGLNKDCLFATLILIIKQETNIYALMIGDGCLIYKEKNDIKYIVHEYKDNYPYYPIYIKSDVPNNEKELIVRRIEGDTHLPFESIQLYTFECDSIEWFIGSSDGMFSFTNGSEILSFEAMKEKVSDLKSFTGDFIERKMKRIFKTLHKDGFYPSDDWSLAGFYLGEPQ